MYTVNVVLSETKETSLNHKRGMYHAHPVISVFSKRKKIPVKNYKVVQIHVYMITVMFCEKKKTPLKSQKGLRCMHIL